MPAAAPEIIGNVKTVDWHPGTGELKGEGPVIIHRRPPGGKLNGPPQVLKATRLDGNTLKQLYTLQGPVEIEAPEERSWFRGGAIQFDVSNQWLKSAAPFQAQKEAWNCRERSYGSRGSPPPSALIATVSCGNRAMG